MTLSAKFDNNKLPVNDDEKVLNHREIKVLAHMRRLDVPRPLSSIEFVNKIPPVILYVTLVLKCL